MEQERKPARTIGGSAGSVVLNRPAWESPRRWPSEEDMTEASEEASPRLAGKLRLR